MEKERMGLFSCVALIAGACIGSAIFSLSGITVFMAGGSAVLSWLIAAAVYMAYGTLLAELSSRYPDSGGIYMFPRRAVPGRSGNLLAFLSGWGYIVSNTVAVCFSAVFAGTYFMAGFPELSVATGGNAVSMIALLLSVSVLFIGARRSQAVQNAMVIILVAALAVYCSFAFFGGEFRADAFDDFFTSGSMGPSGFISAVPLALVAYGGCVVIPFMVSEVRNPHRNVPLSLCIGLFSVAVIYVAVIAAIAGTLPAGMLSDEKLRMIPLFASVSDGTLSKYGILLKLLSICGTVALMTTVIALMRVNSRAMQVMAAQGCLPDCMFKETASGTLPVAVVSMAAVAAVMCFFPSAVMALISLGALLNIVSMTVTIAALLFSRRCGNVSGGFSAPLGVFLPATVLLVFVVCYVPDVLSGGGLLLMFTLAVYAAGMAFYIPGLAKSRKRVTGIVVHGKGHGAAHGIPTANLMLFEGEKMPRFGVWSTTVFVDGLVMDGVTNVGLRPSDDDSSLPTVETMILDFEGDLYGKRMTVRFDAFIRETAPFNGLDELRVRIAEDVRFRRGTSPLRTGR